MIFTSGIEKMIQAHAPTPFAPRSEHLPAVPRFRPRQPNPSSPFSLFFDDEESDEDSDGGASGERADGTSGRDASHDEDNVPEDLKESRRVLEHFDALLEMEREASTWFVQNPETFRANGGRFVGDSSRDGAVEEDCDDDSEEDGEVPFVVELPTCEEDA